MKQKETSAYEGHRGKGPGGYPEKPMTRDTFGRRAKREEKIKQITQRSSLESGVVTAKSQKTVETAGEYGICSLEMLKERGKGKEVRVGVQRSWRACRLRRERGLVWVVGETGFQLQGHELLKMSLSQWGKRIRFNKKGGSR